MGAPDEYTTQTVNGATVSNPNAGFENNLMGTISGSVNEQNIGSVLGCAASGCYNAAPGALRVLPPMIPAQLYLENPPRNDGSQKRFYSEGNGCCFRTRNAYLYFAGGIFDLTAFYVCRSKQCRLR